MHFTLGYWTNVDKSWVKDHKIRGNTKFCCFLLSKFWVLLFRAIHYLFIEIELKRFPEEKYILTIILQMAWLFNSKKQLWITGLRSAEAFKKFKSTTINHYTFTNSFIRLQGGNEKDKAKKDYIFSDKNSTKSRIGLLFLKTCLQSIQCLCEIVLTKIGRATLQLFSLATHCSCPDFPKFNVCNFRESGNF